MALRSYLFKNSQVLRIQSSETSAFPYFTLPSPKGKQLFEIDPKHSLKDLKAEISSKFSTDDINFYSIDGSRLSLNSSLLDSTIDPLNIKIGQNNMYTLYNLNKDQLYLTPSQRALVQHYEKEKNLSKQEAEVIGALNYYILNELQESSANQISSEAFSLIVKNAILQYGAQISHQKQVFEAQLELTRSQFKYELIIHEEAMKKAEIHANKMIKRFFYIILAQFSAVQYGTYHLYSWDIMEPITCMMGMGDVCLGYLFWLLCGKKEYGMEGIKDYFFEKKYKKIIKRKGLSFEEIKAIQTTIQNIENRIKSL